MSSTPCNSSCSSIKTWCRTEARVDEVDFDWTICNFDFLEAKGTVLKSSPFSAPTNKKFEWCLECKPAEENNSVSMYLNLITNISGSILVKLTTSILNQQQIATNTRQIDVREYTSSRNWGWPKFLTKNADFKELLSMNNNELTFRCNLRFSEMGDVDISFHQCPPKSVDNLSEDLALLFEKQEFSDVIISVKCKDFKAHKNILTARSPVFAAMFRHNTTEVEQNRVVIDDVSENVMGDVLRYIYTGKCRYLSKFAKELLIAADKYALDGLKMMCMEELSKTLSVGNAVTILELADKHNAKDLKVEAIKFIVSKFSEIVKTYEWNNILYWNCNLAREICQALARR